MALGLEGAGAGLETCRGGSSSGARRQKKRAVVNPKTFKAEKNRAGGGSGGCVATGRN